MSSYLVPHWFTQATTSGATRDELRKMTADFCLEALRYKAAQKGEVAPDTAPDTLIDLTLEMYEYAMKADKESA
jgi:hypothetical protein